MAGTGQRRPIMMIALALALATGGALALASQAGAVTSRHEIFSSQIPTGVESFDPGPTGGLFGRKIRRAITTFQTARGLRVTGVIDKPTLRELRAIQPDWGKTPPPGATSYSAAGPVASEGEASAEPEAPDAGGGEAVQIAASGDAETARDVAGALASARAPTGITVRLFGVGMSSDAFVALTTFLGFILTLGLGIAVTYRGLRLPAVRRAVAGR